jgi:hypothetical protein
VTKALKGAVQYHIDTTTMSVLDERKSRGFIYDPRLVIRITICHTTKHYPGNFETGAPKSDVEVL